MRNAIKIASLAAAALLATTSASAQVVTFAQFFSNATGTNFRWVRSAGTNTAAGRTVNFYTTTTQNATSAGATAVTFGFKDLGPFSSTVGSVNAAFLMTGTVTDTAATSDGTTVSQTNITGSFSFIANTPISYGPILNGTNLLSGTFSSTTFSGTIGGSTGNLGGSSNGGATINFTSDFLTFDPSANLDFNLGMTSINPLLAFLAGRAVGSYRSVVTGQFSADPPPTAPTIPEPGTWAMMITGMGLVGFARRRRRTAVAA